MQKVKLLITSNFTFCQNDFNYWTFIFRLLLWCFQCRLLQIYCNCMGKGFNPFPHTTILQQTTLNVFCQNIENLHNWMDNLWQKRGKHCGKRRNCTFCAIFSFVTMFSKSRLLQRRQKASIWGKGLIHYLVLLVHIHQPL